MTSKNAYSIDALARSYGLDPQLLAHVLNGDAYNGAHFLHSNVNNFTIVEALKPADIRGVTKDKIGINGAEKTSTLYPPLYDAEAIARAGKEALSNKVPSKKPGYDIGYDNKGLPIIIEYKSTDGKLGSFYSVHQSELASYAP
jgi:hypothetical protein